MSELGLTPTRQQKSAIQKIWWRGENDNCLLYLTKILQNYHNQNFCGKHGYAIFFSRFIARSADCNMVFLPKNFVPAAHRLL